MTRSERSAADRLVNMRGQRFILYGLVALAICASSYAEELNVVASAWRPYVDDRLHRNGIAVHLVTEALQRAGYPSRVTLIQWPGDLEAAKAGDANVIASVWFTEERAQQLAFSKPYIVTETHFVKRRGTPHKFDTPADLQGLRIGVVEGYAYGGDARARPLDVTPVFSGSVLDNLRSLVAGELDLVLADERVALYELSVNVPDGIRKTLILPEVWSSRGLRMGVSRQRPDHAEIVTRFDAAIEAMKADGTYAWILATHRVSAN